MTDLYALASKFDHQLKAYQQALGSSPSQDGVKVLMHPMTYHQLLGGGFAVGMGAASTLFGVPVLVTSDCPSGELSFVLGPTHKLFSGQSHGYGGDYANGGCPSYGKGHHTHSTYANGGGPGKKKVSSVWTESTPTPAQLTCFYDEKTNEYQVHVGAQLQSTLDYELMEQCYTGQATQPEWVHEQAWLQLNEMHGSVKAKKKPKAPQQVQSPFDGQIDSVKIVYDMLQIDSVKIGYDMLTATVKVKWGTGVQTQAVNVSADAFDTVTSMPHSTMPSWAWTQAKKLYLAQQGKQSPAVGLFQQQSKPWFKPDAVYDQIQSVAAKQSVPESPGKCSCSKLKNGIIKHSAFCPAHAGQQPSSTFWDAKASTEWYAAGIDQELLTGVMTKSWFPGDEIELMPVDLAAIDWDSEDEEPGLDAQSPTGTWWVLDPVVKADVEKALALGTTAGNDQARFLAKLEYERKCECKAKPLKDVSDWSLSDLLERIDMPDAVVVAPTPSGGILGVDGTTGATVTGPSPGGGMDCEGCGCAVDDHDFGGNCEACDCEDYVNG